MGWNVWFFPRDFASQSSTFVPRQHCSAPPTNRGEPGVSGAADTELAGGRCRRLSGSASAAKQGSAAMAGYGAIEQMGSEAAPQRPARSAGRAKRAKSSTGPGEGSFLYEAGLGFDKENRCRTISLLSCLVFVTIGVTAWMQTCVPFCGAKTFKTGLWKDAWNNVTIPSDMLGSMDTTVDPCQDFYQFACGGFVESTGIKGDQVKWAEETRVCVCVVHVCM